MPMEWTDVGGITDNWAEPNGHRCLTNGRHAVCVVARHHKQRQSCKRNTDPHVFLHIMHVDDTGKLPSIHWCGIIMFWNYVPSIKFIHFEKIFTFFITHPFRIFDDFSTNRGQSGPFTLEMINKKSVPIFTKALIISYTHQFAIALAAHRLCALHLQTSHDNPCDVTEIDKRWGLKWKFWSIIEYSKNSGEFLLKIYLLKSRHTLQYVGRCPDDMNLLSTNRFE